MSLRIDSLTIDAHDPEELANWWAAALDYRISSEEDDEVLIRPADGGTGVPLLFARTSDDKIVKNRFHFDLRPDERDAEVSRLERLGAKRVDIGQTGEESWVVLADPEGNELCVLASRAV
jgi:hypothetical protein